MKDISNDDSAVQARELELLAVLDHFAHEVDAGAEPRLATYLERYPQFAAELAEFASGYLVDARLPDAESVEIAGLEASRVKPGELSAGSRRALASLFPDSASHGYRALSMPSNAVPPSEESGLRAVAEQPGEYMTSRAGLVALAARRGLSLEELARLTDLPVEALLWLDARNAANAPDALIERLADALGIEPLAVRTAMSSGGDAMPALSGVELAEALLTHPALAAEQRGRWTNLLLKSDS